MKDVGMVRHIVPLLGPIQKTATFSTKGCKLSKFMSAMFLVLLGAMDTDSFVMTVQASADVNLGTPTALAFSYRLTAAAGTDTLGDLTAVAASGLTLAHATFDNKAVIVEVDGAELTDAKPYVGLTFTDPGNADAVIGVVALLKPRYPQATNDGALT
uniref:Uncharacterized protein n=1 Tax=viral metagenome TaxID=1070528 RepID=A0A6H1ZJD3_9ZZZZ